jgi:hypothetical protein
MTVRVPIYDNNRRRTKRPGFGRRLFRLLRTPLLLLLILAGAAAYLTQPIPGLERGGATVAIDAGRLRRTVEELTTKFSPRDAGHPENLDLAARSIRERFVAAGLAAAFQVYEAEGKSWRNVVATIEPAPGGSADVESAGGESTDVVVVGAHYDAFGGYTSGRDAFGGNTSGRDAFGPAVGADDNASGVAGLLELAPLLAAQRGSARIELVAYTLEEPPYFRTRFMGSRVHAAGLK